MTEDVRGEERQALQQLRAAGVLSAAEFEAAMARLPAAPADGEQPAPPEPDPAASPPGAFDQPTPPPPDPVVQPPGAFDQPAPPPPDAVAEPASATPQPPGAWASAPQAVWSPQSGGWPPSGVQPPQSGAQTPQSGTWPAQSGTWPAQSGTWPAQPEAWSADAQPPGPVSASTQQAGWSSPPASAPSSPTPPAAGTSGNPLDEVRIPPHLVAVGDRLAVLARRVVAGDARHLWTAAATAAGVISLLQVVAVLLAAGGGFDQVVGNPIRGAIAVVAVATPAALHAAIGHAGGEGLGRALGITANVPPTLLTVLLLAIFGLLAHRRWRRQPPAGLQAAGLEVLRAVVALTGVAVLAALLTTIAGSWFVADGPQLRAGLWSTAWWAIVLGTPTAVIAIAPLLRARAGGQPDGGRRAGGQAAGGPLVRPLAVEGLAAARGALTGTFGLLGLALLLIVVAGMRELVIAQGEGVVAGMITTLLLLPTAMILVAGLVLAVPVSAETGAAVPGLTGGEQVAVVGLRGIEGMTGASAAVPLWAWLVFLVAVLVLVMAGAGATWRAAAEGVKATRAGMAVGPVMALLWLPLGLLTSLTVRVDGAASIGLLELLHAIGLRGATGLGEEGLRIGLDVGVLFATLLILGAGAGWLGSLVAKQWWGRAPQWVVRLLAGRPRAGTPRPPSAV